jgi:hypothetical protein
MTSRIFLFFVEIKQGLNNFTQTAWQLLTIIKKGGRDNECKQFSEN